MGIGKRSDNGRNYYKENGYSAGYGIKGIAADHAVFVQVGHDSNESDTNIVHTGAEDISGHDGSIHKGLRKHQGTDEDNRLLQVCYFCVLLTMCGIYLSVRVGEEKIIGIS